MKRIIFFLLIIYMSLAASAQRLRVGEQSSGMTIEVSGTVKDLGNKPVADVIVKVVSGKATLAFATTNAQGAYALSYDPAKAKGSEALLTFSHIAYEKEEAPLSSPQWGKSPKKNVHDVILLPKTISLKEVKVKADPLRLKGDTLSYNLASFLGKGDVTLEDGLKRLPGISVSDNGAISYMGQGISKFYIEGLDMLGGRYNLATKNIPADYATQVEVMRHHKARRVDKDEESDAVALNIRLAKKAKFKLFGQEVAGIGASPPAPLQGERGVISSADESAESKGNHSPLLGRGGGGEAGVRPLGALGLTGMMFTDKFQLLGSTKFSNHGNFGSYDIIDHYGNSSISSLATDRLGGWGGGRPPLGAYLYETNGYGTLNGISKLDSTRQLRVNADYTYNRYHNTYETTTTYYLPDSEGGVSIIEESRPLATVHRPMLELRYEDNAPNHYLMEMLRLQAQFEENECPVWERGRLARNVSAGEPPALQQREAKSLSVQNDLWGTISRGSHKQSFRSEIEFNRAPKVRLDFGDGVVQTGQSTTFSPNHSTSFTLKLGEKWRIGLPMYLKADYNMIETKTLPPPSLKGGSSYLQGQRVSGWNITPSVSPNTEWRSANQKAYVSMSCGFEWRVLTYNIKNYQSSGNHSLPHREGWGWVFLEPRASFRYTFSGTSELSFSSGLSNLAGDILDLLTTPVQTSYRSTSAASGVIGRSQRWNSSLGYKFQVPFSYFSLDANASWAQGKHNVLSSQVVSGTDVANSSIFRDSHFKSASGSVSLSKNILPITTKLTLTAGGSWGSSESMSQSVLVTTYTSDYNTDLRAVVTPISWTELTLSGTYSKHFQHIGGSKEIVDGSRAHASLALYPIARLELRASYDLVRSQISSPAGGSQEGASHKTASLLSASAQLKLKRTVWRLSLDNLLNTRHYTYTTFSATDRYTFDSHLIGRTALLTCKLNLAK